MLAAESARDGGSCRGGDGTGGGHHMQPQQRFLHSAIRNGHRHAPAVEERPEGEATVEVVLRSINLQTDGTNGAGTTDLHR